MSPDAGGAKRVVSIADRLNVNFALIHKEVGLGDYQAILILSCGRLSCSLPCGFNIPRWYYIPQIESRYLA